MPKPKDPKNQKVPHLLQGKKKHSPPCLHQKIFKKILKALKHSKISIKTESGSTVEIDSKKLKVVIDLRKKVWVELKKEYNPNANKGSRKTSQKKLRKDN